MTRKRPERQRNLAGLLAGAADLTQPGTSPVHHLPVDALRPGSQQPRRAFDEAGLESLAESVRREGVLQPLLVRPVDVGHEIVAGERRWRAAQRAGLTEVPVVVRELTDREAQRMALVENLQREDLNTVDEVDAKLDLVASVLGLPREDARARLMQLLRGEPGEEHAALESAFAPLGENWTSFAKNKLRILKWPSVVLEAVRAGLPFTLGSIIVAAPDEHHAALVALAQTGAGRQEIQAEIKRLGEAKGKEKVPEALRVARVLGSTRFISALDPDARKALDRWLAKMPEAVRNALGD
ncbi:ParB/RepB/Spo0J family partition protein [Deinococcus hopiensis]|uniref:ParB family protein n=1 Tax=Deinococcus hopiensis KR-140 TaxID=695939 RepID=A0A1W1UMU8_9DEIO|nr:ParB/RepB/Spo0J family partition protein [Deinococcus hopiensis]SMB82034.1 ParB family protein [Deinococcus hopiensis KR-140]